MRQISTFALLIFAFLCSSPVYAQTSPLVRAVANGEAVLLMRHALAPGTKEPGTMWTLPYGMWFEEAKASDYLLVDDDLNVLEGSGTPNMANRFHLHVYRARNDAQSLVHTHPPYSSALSMIGEPLHVSHMDTAMFYDDVAHLQSWPGVPFGDEEGEIITEAIGDKNAILLAHHGHLCAGSTIEAACVMAIFFEHAARIQLLAMAAGGIKDIDPKLGKEAHDWRHAPEAMATTFHYFARMALQKHSYAIFEWHGHNVINDRTCPLWVKGGRGCEALKTSA